MEDCKQPPRRLLWVLEFSLKVVGGCECFLVGVCVAKSYRLSCVQVFLNLPMLQ